MINEIIVGMLVDRTLSWLWDEAATWITKNPNLRAELQYAYIEACSGLFQKVEEKLSGEEQQVLNTFLTQETWLSATLSYQFGAAGALTPLQNYYPPVLATKVPFAELATVLQEHIRKGIKTVLPPGVRLWLAATKRYTPTTLDALHDYMESRGRSGASDAVLEELLAIHSKLKRGTNLEAHFQSADAIAEVALVEAKKRPSPSTYLMAAKAHGNLIHFHEFVDNPEKLLPNIYNSLKTLEELAKYHDKDILRELYEKRGDALKICQDFKGAQEDIERATAIQATLTEASYQAIRTSIIVAGKLNSLEQFLTTLGGVKNVIEKSEAPQEVIAHVWNGVYEGCAYCFERTKSTEIRAEAITAYETACRLQDLVPWQLPADSPEDPLYLDARFPEFEVRNLRGPVLLSNCGVTTDLDSDERRQFARYAAKYSENIGSWRTAIKSYEDAD
ncbi:MAG: hypothetical protein HYX84_08080 [Chloroflexi bacterium]|nr:hypothetical protein [Chloroflexota bacterium]